MKSSTKHKIPFSTPSHDFAVKRWSIIYIFFFEADNGIDFLIVNCFWTLNLHFVYIHVLLSSLERKILLPVSKKFVFAKAINSVGNLQ